MIRTYAAPASRAVEYARRGLALHGLDDATRAMLLARLGRSLAVVPGQERHVRRALEEAQILAAQLSPLDGAEIMANSGIALSDCGLHSQGTMNLQSAVYSVPPETPLLLALYQARLIRSAIHARDVQSTVGAITALASVAPLVTSRRLEIHVRYIMEDTQTWTSIREIKDARQRLTEVTK